MFFGCRKSAANEPYSSNTIARIDISTVAVIDESRVQQYIYGFAGADIIDWTGDLTAAQRDTDFSPTSGIGFSIVRVRVPANSSEFSQAKATIDACKAYGGSAIASVWSAPASMKTLNYSVQQETPKLALDIHI